MEYSIIIEKNPTTGVYVGQCSQLPEAMSQGNTLAELMANMKEAIELAVECRREELQAVGDSACRKQLTKHYSAPISTAY